MRQSREKKKNTPSVGSLKYYLQVFVLTIRERGRQLGGSFLFKAGGKVFLKRIKPFKVIL